MLGAAERHLTLRWRGGGRPAERGAAVVDFALVSGLVVLLFMMAFQVGLALHVRNTLISCAAEGARLGARIDATPAQGAARARDLIGRSLSPRYAEHVSAGVVTVDGVRVVTVRVEAPLPVIALYGPSGTVEVTGRAFMERQGVGGMP